MYKTKIRRLWSWRKDRLVVTLSPEEKYNSGFLFFFFLLPQASHIGHWKSQQSGNANKHSQKKASTKSKTRGSSQDGGIGRNASVLHTTKRRITTNLKAINKQKCQKNQTAWNSNNQRVKETFTQTGRRGRDRRQAAEWSRWGRAGWTGN